MTAAYFRRFIGPLLGAAAFAWPANAQGTVASLLLGRVSVSLGADTTLVFGALGADGSTIERAPNATFFTVYSSAKKDLTSMIGTLDTKDGKVTEIKQMWHSGATASAAAYAQTLARMFQTIIPGSTGRKEANANCTIGASFEPILTGHRLTFLCGNATIYTETLKLQGEDLLILGILLKQP